MKQSTAWVLAAVGVFALSACGTTKNSINKTVTTIDGNTGGDGDGGNGDGGDGGNGGGDGGNGGTTSRVPAGPSGPLSGNVDFKLSKSDADLVKGIIGGLSTGNGPTAVLGGLLGIGNALGSNLNNGTQSCDSGTYNSTSSGDSDRDGIPNKATVTFNNCKFSFDLNNQKGTLKLNGSVELEDHNNSDDDTTFLLVTDLQVSGSGGSLDLGGVKINLNNSATLKLGLDITKKSNSYDIAFGINLGVDNTTLSARLDANIVPNNMGNFGAGGAINLSGKVGLSQSGNDSVIGFSSKGLTYDGGCAGLINKGTVTITDGVHNLEIIQQACGLTDGKLDGNFIDL
jgi:hypothetical protein